ncbi:unnamed protein product [Cunninghamella blakesleeana]
MSNHELFDNLIDLELVNNETIANLIRTRYLHDKTFTRLSHPVLLSLNPYKELRHTIEELSQLYFEEYKNTKHITHNNSIATTDSHIFQHVNQAYFHMRRAGQD